MDSEEIIKLDRFVHDVKGNLKIIGLDPSDSGQYECSHNGSVFTILNLQVIFAPVISNYSQGFEIDENRYADLYCLSEGNPLPTVTWSISEDNILDTTHSNWSRIGNGSQINISLPCSNCKIKVKCMSENTLGGDSKVISVLVGGKPRVTIPNRIVNRRIRQHIPLRCLVKSATKVSVNWKRNGVKVPNLKEERMNIDFKVKNWNEFTFILIIRELKETDFGTYECFAHNKYGNNTEEISLLLSPGRSRHRKPHVSSLSASTDRAISSDSLPRQTPKTKNRDVIIYTDTSTAIGSGSKYSTSGSNMNCNCLLHVLTVPTVLLFKLFLFL